MIVVGNEEHGHIIAKKAGTTFNPAIDIVISRVLDDRLRGGVIYNNYTGASVGMHVWGEDTKWIDRDILWVAFDYPFRQLGCKKVFGQIPANNVRALEFDLKLGFKIEARIKDVFPDEDLIVVSMSREDCRWLKVRPSRAFLNQEAA